VWRRRAIIDAQGPTALVFEHYADASFLAPTTRHRNLVASTSSAKVKASGISTGLITSSAAPVSEKSRTVQLIPPPPSNVIVPAFSTRCFGDFRSSSMAFNFALKYRNSSSPAVNVFGATPYHERDHSRIWLTRPVPQPSNRADCRRDQPCDHNCRQWPWHQA
jgi:hypothetical protein